MTMLALRAQSLAEARLRLRTGTGLRFDFTLDGEPGWLQLTLAAANPPRRDERALRSERGVFWLSNPEAACSLLSACPLVMEPGEESWYWPLFNQLMSQELRELFGTLTLEAPAPADSPTLGLHMTVQRGEMQADTLLYAPVSTLDALLYRPGWQPLTAPGAEELGLTVPLITGTLSFSLAQLRALRPDDVVLPTVAHFSPQGQGALRLGKLTLQGELAGEEGQATRFYITELETTDVNLTPDDYAMDDIPPADEARSSEPHTTTSAFDPLPLALNLRCGHIRLTLGELNRLGVGSTVIAEHVVPGEALLCHGEYPLAKGELVNVEGRLGLQITHMLPGAVNPLGKDR